jgi:hypothetical protein
MMNAMPANFVHFSPSMQHQEHPQHTIGIHNSSHGNWNAPSQELLHNGQHQHDMAYHTTAPVTSFVDSKGEKFKLQDDAKVWQLDGPINFVSMFAIDNMIIDLKSSLTSTTTETEPSVVVDMDQVTNLEFTGMEELVMRLVEVQDVFNAKIQMVNCNSLVEQALDQCDPQQQIQRFGSLTAAV